MHSCEYFFECIFVKFFHSPLILLNERMLTANTPFSPIKEERKRTFWYQVRQTIICLFCRRERSGRSVWDAVGGP